MRMLARAELALAIIIAAALAALVIAAVFIVASRLPIW